MDGPLRSAPAGTPAFASPVLFTNAHRCFNIISCGTRCYLSFRAPLRRHLPVFSRHDINSPKEARSLTDLPSWNLTDNDFVFAEAGAPWGVGEEQCVMDLCFNPPPLQISKMARGMWYFIVVRPHYISMIDGEPRRFCALRSVCRCWRRTQADK